MRIAVFGLGKIGLPLAVQFAEGGHQVAGVDIDADRVRIVNEGGEPFPGERDLGLKLRRVVARGSLVAVADAQEAVESADAVVVAVPLLVSGPGRPEFGPLDSATSAIGKSIKRGTLVSFETTVPIGTTRGRLTVSLEAASGLSVGTDFHVVFSPERVSSGRIFADLARYPKLVGGVTQVCEEVGVSFYESVLSFDHRPDLARPNGVWPMGSAEAAELAKLAETTYRDVNIALANQFAEFADSRGIDIRLVIESCNSQPYSHLHQPGISVGGHCIPVYPELYLSGDPNASLVRVARDINESMPVRAVERLVQYLGAVDGLSILILGLTYRPGVKESAFSGCFALNQALRDLGADVSVHDTIFTAEEIRDLGLAPAQKGQGADAAIVHTSHPEYIKWMPADIPGIRVILDGRRFLPQDPWLAAGIKLLY